MIQSFLCGETLRASAEKALTGFNGVKAISKPPRSDNRPHGQDGPATL